MMRLPEAVVKPSGFAQKFATGAEFPTETAIRFSP